MIMAKPVADLAPKELNQLEESDTEEELDELNTSLGRGELDGSDTGADLVQDGRDGPKDKHLGSDLSFSTQTTQGQDPFSFSNGPITRSKTRQLKEAILRLVYTKPISTSEENQVKEALKIFNCSIFNTT